METGEIVNDAIISNSYHSYHQYYHGRLNSGAGFEANLIPDPERHLFFRVDLGPSAAIITGIATQGGTNVAYNVRRYTLRFSDDKLDWKSYTDGGRPKVIIRFLLK
jgi:hypothetical protein